jgi:transcriptional regulator with XRE-family HTH domain
MTQSDPHTGEHDASRENWDEDWDDYEEVTAESEDQYFDEKDAESEERWQAAWSSAVVATLAEEVGRRRNERGLSQHELAAECAKIGYPIPRNVLANLESGRRSSLQVVELLVLAKALNCSPVALLFPVGHSTSVYPLPGEPQSPLDAADWFSAMKLGDEEDWIFAYRSHVTDMQALAMSDDSLLRLEESLKSCTNADERESLQGRFAAARLHRNQLVSRITETVEMLESEGMLPPEPEFVDYRPNDRKPPPPKESA